MSGGTKCLELTSEDCRKMLASKMHLGSTNSKYQMSQYIHNRAAGVTGNFGERMGGAHIFDVKKMWEKIVLAARIIVAIENPSDVCVVSSKEQGQRSIIKFSKFTGSSQINGRFSPGTFTNHSQAGFREPRLLVVTDPSVDHQAIREASYVNIPVISLCDADSCLKYIDIAIPCNNKGSHAIGLAWWFLTREVLRLRGTISRKSEWEVMPDLFFFRDLKQIMDQEKELEAEKKKEEETEMPPMTDGMDLGNAVYGDEAGKQWNEEPGFEAAGAENQDWATPATTGDWATEGQAPAVTTTTTTAAVAAAATTTPAATTGGADWATADAGTW